MLSIPTIVIALFGISASLASTETQCTPQFSPLELQEHLLEACEPLNHTGKHNLNTPCGVEASIQMQCIYSASPEKAALPDYEFPFRNTPMVSNATLRDCLCQTHIFEIIKACSACNKAHGGLEGFGWETDDSYDSARSTYCAASATPTLNFADFMSSALASRETKHAHSTKCSSFSDPAGSATDVAVYYTPSIPLSVANRVALPMPTETGQNATSYTSLYVSDGQIMPTPTTGHEHGGHRNKKGQDNATSTAGAVPTARLAVGALGFAAMAVVL